MTTSKSPPKPSPMPAIEHYRVLSNLDHLIASSPAMFWCYAHLADLPLSEQSLDPRYCNACNAVLTREREDSRASGNYRKPWWVPQNGKSKGKDSVVVEIAMSHQKGLIPISASCASIPDKAKVRDFEKGIIHHRPRETLRKRHQWPIKRGKAAMV